MAFNPKSWRNGRAGGTKVDAEAMIDLETRLSGYSDSRFADSIAGGNIDLTGYTDGQVPAYDPGTDSLLPSSVVSTSEAPTYAAAYIGRAIYASHQAAVEAAAAAAMLASGVLELPGLATLTGFDEWSPPSGLRVRGNGCKLVAKANLTSLHAAIHVAAATTDVVMEDVEIDGNATNQTNTAFGVMVQGSSIVLRRFYVHDTRHAGIAVDSGASDVELDAPHTYNTGAFGIVGGYYLSSTLPITRLKIHDFKVDTTANGFSGVGFVVSVGTDRSVTDAAITSGTATLTSATAAFTAADVGRTVLVTGAGSAGGQLNARITGFTNSTTVTLEQNASTTVAAAAATILAAPSPGTVDCEVRDGEVYRTDHDGCALYSPNNVRLKVHNVLVDNTGFTPSVGGQGGHAVHIAGSDVEVDGIRGFNMDGAGILASAYPNQAPPPQSGLFVGPCTINTTVEPANGEGLVTQNYSDVLVVGFKAIGCKQQGIHIAGAYGGYSAAVDKIRIFDAVCETNGAAGIEIDEATNIIVTAACNGNGTVASDAGIRLKGVISATIRAQCSNNTLDGVRLVDGTTTACLDVELDVQATSNGNWGVQATGSANRILVNGAFRSNTNGQISLVGSSSRVGSVTYSSAAPTVASAATITLPDHTDVINVTGTTAITSIALMISPTRDADAEPSAMTSMASARTS